MSRGFAGGVGLLRAARYGAAAIAARLGGSVVGGAAGGAGGSYVGGRVFGEGSTGQSVLAFGGGLVGGGLGYGAGARVVSAPRPVPQSEVVAFFGRDAVDKYYMGERVQVGAPGRSFFVMPVEDAVVVRSAGDAARYTGMAPSAQNAYLTGGDVYGLQFRVPTASMRAPTPADASGWPHYLEGGRTAVRLSDPNGGFLVNPTREFVIPGGSAPGAGSVLFRLDPSGERIPIRRF